MTSDSSFLLTARYHYALDHQTSPAHCPLIVRYRSLWIIIGSHPHIKDYEMSPDPRDKMFEDDGVLDHVLELSSIAVGPTYLIKSEMTGKSNPQEYNLESLTLNYNFK